MMIGILHSPNKSFGYYISRIRPNQT